LGDALIVPQWGVWGADPPSQVWTIAVLPSVPFRYSLSGQKNIFLEARRFAPRQAFRAYPVRPKRLFAFDQGSCVCNPKMKGGIKDRTLSSLMTAMTVSWTPQPTDDGSFTFFSTEFGEAFHSSRGAKAEAFEKFAVATRLVERVKDLQTQRIRLLDVCYGLGYNTAAALETIWAANPQCRIEVYGLELDSTVPEAAIQPPLVEVWSPPLQIILSELARSHHCHQPYLDAHLLIGDARQTIQKLASSGFQADAIFFDPFSPRRCPHLWTVEFFAQTARCLASGGILATYSRAASVRRAMQLAGLHVGSIPLSPGAGLPHEWSQGTVASVDIDTLPPLSPMEMEHLQTRAAIPYRDPTLQDAPEVIVERHQQEQGRSPLESTTSWRRRWGVQ